MPSLAKRSCSMPGCNNVAASSRCDACSKSWRGTTSQRGYDGQHQRLRVNAFERDEWRCQSCGWRPHLVVQCEEYGIDQPPTQLILGSLRDAYKRGEVHLQADHIIAIEAQPELKRTLSNYATLCSRCHHDKTRGFTVKSGGAPG